MDFDNSSRILIIAAHPDDEVLAMGGTIALAKSLGATVVVKFLGEGVSARFTLPELKNDEFARQSEIRVAGAKNALAVLDVDEVIFGSRLCCRFDEVSSLEVVKDIEETIVKFDPTHIFTHNSAEVNIDHRITYKCVEAAVRPRPGIRLSGIYGFEIVCSGNWTFSDQFKPTTFVNIQDYWVTKIDAWHCYVGEERPFPFPRSVEGLETLAKFRGMQCGLRLAEGFCVFRETV